MKEHERKWSSPNLRHYSGICLKGLRKITKNLSEDSQSLNQDLNLEPPIYEAGAKQWYPLARLHGVTSGSRLYTEAKH
jgi:hypothetical protein